MGVGAGRDGGGGADPAMYAGVCYVRVSAPNNPRE